VSRRDDKAMAGSLDNKPAPVSNCDDRACVDAKTIRHSIFPLLVRPLQRAFVGPGAAAMRSALPPRDSRSESMPMVAEVPEKETRKPSRELGRGTRRGRR